MTGHLIGGPGSAATAAFLIPTVTDAYGVGDPRDISDETRDHYANWDTVPADRDNN
ncbi:hypothetical protein ACLM5J_03635 [Nocardioides sp. Bht2]|uniref:hypothetical protein n=1 Tax=Nocardioides sp. Bht2 TaxID=3392297 RepID=UPI0039B6691B